jgi:hypothetical protein
METTTIAIIASVLAANALPLTGTLVGSICTSGSQKIRSSTLVEPTGEAREHEKTKLMRETILARLAPAPMGMEFEATCLEEAITSPVTVVPSW